MMKHIPQLLLLFAFLVGCDRGKTITTITSCPSPDGKYTATFYVEQAGGAAGSQYEFLSISEKGHDKKTIIMEIKGGYDLSLHWSGGNKLAIGYPEEARIYRWQSSFGSDFTGLSWLERVPSTGGRFTNKALAGCR